MPACLRRAVVLVVPTSVTGGARVPGVKVLPMHSASHIMPCNVRELVVPEAPSHIGKRGSKLLLATPAQSVLCVQVHPHIVCQQDSTQNLSEKKGRRVSLGDAVYTGVNKVNAARLWLTDALTDPKGATLSFVTLQHVARLQGQAIAGLPRTNTAVITTVP